MKITPKMVKTMLDVFLNEPDNTIQEIDAAASKALAAVFALPEVQIAMADLTQEPKDIAARVEDRDGDVWILGAYGWGLEAHGGMNSWSVVRTFAPLRRLS